MNYRGMRVVILGASGFIGRWVARRLTAEGAQCFLFVKEKTEAMRVFSDYQVAGSIIPIELTDFQSVHQAIHEIQPVRIFNLAGYGVSPSETDETQMAFINTQLPAVLVEARASYPTVDWSGQAIIHVGTAMEYGQILGDLHESARPAPSTPYGMSKLAGTLSFSLSCSAQKVAGITARLFSVYGPGESEQRLLPSIWRAARTHQPIALTEGLHLRDFIYVEDVAEALLRLGICELESGSIVNVATGRLTSVRNFALTAAEILGMPSKQLEFGAIATRAGEMHHDPVSLARLHSSTGWVPPIDVRNGIRKTIEFAPGLM